MGNLLTCPGAQSVKEPAFNIIEHLYLSDVGQNCNKSRGGGGGGYKCFTPPGIQVMFFLSSFHIEETFSVLYKVSMKRLRR